MGVAGVGSQLGGSREPGPPANPWAEALAGQLLPLASLPSDPGHVTSSHRSLSFFLPPCWS